uniref:Uncharacterized protein n=1 Tax=Aegilops tauschii TaxID=37682 RepID=R7WAQ1_AEGTA
MPAAHPSPAHWHAAHLQSLSIDPARHLLYSYSVAAHGFAAALLPHHPPLLRDSPGVLQVVPDTVFQLHTTRTPEFLGLLSPAYQPAIHNLDAASHDVVIGVLDTGVWPESPSFAGGDLPPPPAHWKGVCEVGVDFPASACGRKLVGARSFSRGFRAATAVAGEWAWGGEGRRRQGRWRRRDGAGEHGRERGGARGGQPPPPGRGGGQVDRGQDTGLASVRGKIVLCDRGMNARVEKGAVVKAAGGAGMVLANTAASGEELVADSHLLPAVAVGKSTGDKIRDYAQRGGRPMAMLSFGGTALGIRPSPVVAAFSSRGPNTVVPDILKPDMIGPGVNILAGWSGVKGPTGLAKDGRRTPFNIISGTSMSCPHISGLAALLKAAHPNWSPAAIKSALMTTTYTMDNTNSSLRDAAGSSPATPFGFGAGHVDPQKALSPGLVYDISTNDYVAFLCSLDYSATHIRVITKMSNVSCPPRSRPGDLNYPSFSVVFRKKPRHVSALMTTTYTMANTTSSLRDAAGSSPATPFGFGAGHVDPQKALSPGLVYDISTNDYVAFLCSLDYSATHIRVITKMSNVSCPPRSRPGDLNYPSFSVVFRKKPRHVVRYRRELTNVGPAMAVYDVKVSGPASVGVTVTPAKLVFKKVGQKQRYYVTFESKAAGAGRAKPDFGWISWASDEHVVRSPVAYTWKMCFSYGPQPHNSYTSHTSEVDTSASEVASESKLAPNIGTMTFSDRFSAYALTIFSNANFRNYINFQSLVNGKNA